VGVAAFVDGRVRGEKGGRGDEERETAMILVKLLAGSSVPLGGAQRRSMKGAAAYRDAGERWVLQRV